MSPLVISDSIALFIDGSPRTGFLHYRRHDPYVVRLDVPGFLDEIHILRESFRIGQNILIKDEYVEIQPDAEYPEYWITITVRNVSPEPLVLWAERKSLGRALARTYQMIPRGFELPWDNFPCLE